MFSSVLIANRGEIACRIIGTAARLGIRTIAVYSEADSHALHVRQADEAWAIGPAAAARSYLSIERILEVAASSGAEAIHPGYGFLAENADFAEACLKAGILFVGPPAGAMRAMGGKSTAKALMAEAGVPVVPGYHGDDQADKTLVREAKKIGYPLLIKAVAGGGGKGMRLVGSGGEFKSALEGARREARNAFGDDRMLLEKYMAIARHVEMQIFADRHGNAVHLFERDCSIQRRHQKIIEESPAPGMTGEMRSRMGEAACTAALAIGYEGAGTVEFIADVSDGLEPDKFYFMEMNTRLQVEHPVTEMVTGQDLVEWQFRVAAGQALPLAQTDIRLTGHAIEARLYAEDPAKDFLPGTGRLDHLRFADGEGIRVDAGVEEGDAVTVHYDPMIAKIIAHGASRAAALARLSSALGITEIAGLTTNQRFLLQVLNHPAFKGGEIETRFLDKHEDDLFTRETALPPAVIALAVAAEVLGRPSDPINPWGAGDGWRLGGAAHDRVALAGLGDDGGPLHIGVQRNGGQLVLDLPGGPLTVHAKLEENWLTAEIDGVHLRARALRSNASITILMGGRNDTLVLWDPLEAELDAHAGEGSLWAPMSGKIIQVIKQEGDRVEVGDAVIVMEAMKMEHTLRAARDGRLAHLSARAGDQVAEGARLAEVVDN